MSKTFGQDFTKDVEIDKFNLDEECRIQAAMYYHYAEMYSHARREQDEAKDRLDYVLGKRQIEIRRNPPTDIKITEAVIEALLATDSDVDKAKEAVRVASEKASTLYAAMSAMDHRKSQLDSLVRLHVSNYFNQDEGNSIRNTLNKRGNN